MKKIKDILQTLVLIIGVILFFGGIITDFVISITHPTLSELGIFIQHWDTILLSIAAIILGAAMISISRRD